MPLKPSVALGPPSLLFLAEYHPQVALAVANGVPMRPNLRPLSVELQNSQIGQPQRTSFSEVISQYSIFGGVDVTIDPTNDAPGNPVKYINDASQALVTGVTVSLLVKGAGGEDYSPVPDETPLQQLPVTLAPSIYVWRMVNPENVKAQFIVQTPANATPFTVWLTFTFLVLASAGDIYMQIPADDARKQLIGTLAWQIATGRVA